MLAGGSRVEQLSGWSEGTGVQKHTAHASEWWCVVRSGPPCGGKAGERQSGGAAPRAAACGGAWPRMQAFCTKLASTTQSSMPPCFMPSSHPFPLPCARLTRQNPMNDFLQVANNAFNEELFSRLIINPPERETYPNFKLFGRRGLIK